MRERVRASGGWFGYRFAGTRRWRAMAGPLVVPGWVLWVVDVDALADGGGDGPEVALV
jgi:hypothetical protein